MDYRDTAYRIALEEGVDPDLFMRLISAESSFNPNAVSTAGAYGLAQLMPGTAADLGVDPTDPVQNLRGGARYLRQQIDKFGDTSLALAAYNAGPGNVSKYGGIPPFEETQNYVNKIMGGYSDTRVLEGRPQAAPQEEEEFARGYEPRDALADFFATQREQVQPTDLYNPYEIAQRFQLK